MKKEIWHHGTKLLSREIFIVTTDSVFHLLLLKINTYTVWFAHLKKNDLITITSKKSVPQYI